MEPNTSEIQNPGHCMCINIVRRRVDRQEQEQRHGEGLSEVKERPQVKLQSKAYNIRCIQLM